MKFSPLNIDFSSVSPDPSDSRRPAQVGVKQGYPDKKCYFTAIGWSTVKTVADKHSNELFRNVNIDYLK